MKLAVKQALIALYESRRNQAQQIREQNIQKIYATYPQLAEIDNKIAQAGADLLLEIIAGDKSQEAARRKELLQRQRATIIQENMIDPAFDQPVYECALCQDTGSLGADQCTCYQQTLLPLLIDNANLQLLYNIDFASFDLSLFSDQISGDKAVSNQLSPRKNMQAIKNAVVSYADRLIADSKKKQQVDSSTKLASKPTTAEEHFDERAHDILTVKPSHNKNMADNLLFLGPTGTGKTFMMASLANYVLASGVPVFYIRATELFEKLQELRKLQAAFNPEPEELEVALALYDSLMKTTLLLVDDLATEQRTAATYRELLTLIDARMAPGLSTVISSNADLNFLKNNYDERLLSRLLGHYSVFRFFGADIRLKLSQGRKKSKQQYTGKI